MLGQNRLKEELLAQINNLPRFIILVGKKGSQRSELAALVAHKAGIVTSVVTDISISNIRDIIHNTYRIADKVMYIINDADKMSNEAKQTLLKVTEEPPNNTYFTLTVENIAGVPGTLVSRAHVYTMDNYTKDELMVYAENKYGDISHNDVMLALIDMVDTPAEIDRVVNNAKDFMAYVNRVVDNIATVSGANAFKIAEKIDIKGDDRTKFDLEMFFAAFAYICGRRLTDDVCKYAKGIRITDDAINKLGQRSVNRAMLFDSWLLGIRTAWIRQEAVSWS